MNFLIKNCSLDKEKTDCIVISVFNRSELSDSTAYLDKYSNGYITSLIKLGDIKGNIGDTLMLYNIPNILAKRILLVGCGKKEEINKLRFKEILKNTIKIIKKFSIQDVIYSFSDLNIDDNNIYWMIRIMVLSIKKSLYKIIKIKDEKTNNINIDNITLNILKNQDLFKAKTALKHALAINCAITSAKNLSNLPPNICNPLYLSHKAQELAKKYKNNITVEVIDIKKMKELGMHAYIAVGDGARNKPFMSVIKYSGDNIINNKKIALVGKGLTFDSGGISIKPAFHMHEMKYDMCGAAAVYGALIMAAELQLPLTIIGILSGCENMPGGGAFRPGDVLTTMSGQTVEVLNTDAEGRLVLSDSLTYLERFSPNVVIDIATLTGACVTALGESVSGLFSNNEELSDQLHHAAQETDDKIWSLPLFPEYQQELTSDIADLSNVGKGKAGAITAACFLSNFTKKYRWAHLDIAGTAWKSGKNKGATGRPVELLCQFLLNQVK